MYAIGQRTPFPSAPPGGRTRLVVDEATLEDLRGMLGPHADRMVHDAAHSIGARHYLERALDAIQHDERLSHVDYLPIRNAQLPQEVVADIVAAHPDATHLLLVRVSRGTAAWWGQFLKLGVQLPETTLAVIQGRRTGDVVDGAGRADRIVEHGWNADEEGTHLSIATAHVHVDDLVGSTTRRFGPLRRLGIAILEDIRRVAARQGEA